VELDRHGSSSVFFLSLKKKKKKKSIEKGSLLYPYDQLRAFLTRLLSSSDTNPAGRARGKPCSILLFFVANQSKESVV
jgi:hypothetical protein